MTQKQGFMVVGIIALVAGTIYLLKKKKPVSGKGDSLDPGFPLKRGVTSDKVSDLQFALGFSKKDIDGNFGPKTELALKNATGLSQIDSQAQLDELLHKAGPGNQASLNQDFFKGD